MTDSYQAIDRRNYARLLAKTLPAVIETEEQNERMLREVERLIDKSEGNLSREEETLSKLITTSVEDFEEQHYQVNAATPVTILKELNQDPAISSQLDSLRFLIVLWVE